MSSPLISVVCCVHNGQESLNQTISSILQNSFECFEFLIVDDGSTDGTAAILNECRLLDSRVKILTRIHQGLTKSLIEACQLCRGELIARIDCGDTAHPTRLLVQSNIFVEEPKLLLCGTEATVADHRGIEIGVNRCYTPRPDTALMTWNPFIHSSVMFRKSVYEAVGGYRAEISYAQDYDLWTRIARQGQTRIITDRLVCVRLDLRGLSFARNQEQINFGADIAQAYCLRKLGKEFPQDFFFQHFSLAMAPNRRAPLSRLSILRIILQRKNILILFSSMCVEHKIKWGLFFLLGRRLYQGLFSIRFARKYQTES